MDRTRAGAVAVVLVTSALLVAPWRAATSFGVVIVELVCVALFFAAIGHQQLSPSRPWYLVGAGLAALALGDLAWAVLTVMDRATFPSPVDTVYLAGMVIAAWGLVLMLRARSAGDQTRRTLDAVTIGFTGAALVWILVLQPLGSAADMGDLVAASYAVFDVLLMVGAVALGFGAPGGGRAQRLLVAAISIGVVGDVLFLLDSAGSSMIPDGIARVRYVMIFGLCAVAAWDPSAKRLLEPAPPRLPDVSRGQLAAMLASISSLPILILARSILGDAGTSMIIAAACSLVVIALVLARVTDLVRRVRATADRHGQTRLAALVENANDVVLVLRPDGRTAYVSPSMARMWGHAHEDLVDRDLSGLLHEADRTAFVDRFRALRTAGPGASLDVQGRIHHADGRIRWFEASVSNLLHEPAVAGIVCHARDVTDRVELETELRHQALHDPLTGLANRALFDDRVAQALTRTRRVEATVALMFIDLDDFKTVNDALGHAAGDHLLRVVGCRLAAVVRPEDTVARLGGDEFGVLVESHRDAATVEDLASRVLDAVREPVRLDDVDWTPGASIGVALAGHPDTSASLLRNADSAMYAAKAGGKGRASHYVPTMHAEARRRLEHKADLARALELDELHTVYQPIVDLATGQVTGAEALMRWTNTARGAVAPTDFIPLAEETGLIVPLGAWILEDACAAAAGWQQGGQPPIGVAVNVSAVQLQQHDFDRKVADVLQRTGLAADLLTIELTESVLVAEPDLVAETFVKLKQLGVRLAVDDFGTGYSNLASLSRFAFDVLKVDRSFVAGLHEDEGNRLTTAVIELSHALGLRTIAEGVEDVEQLEALRRAGCDAAQGYLLARPLDDAALRDLIGRGLITAKAS